MNSLIRMFKAVEIKSKRKRKVNKSVFEQTLKYGFVFSPEVAFNYSDTELIELTEQIKNDAGLSLDQLNNSFHKSWKKIKESDIEQLVFEQLVHYFTTYGFESLGIYNENSVYIPNEKLEIPEIDIDGFNFVIIRGYKKDEIKNKVIDLLKSGIALSDDSIKDIVELAIYVDIGQENVNDIKNKEAKIALCDHLKIFPENPTEFLRYVIYKTIDRTLLIKDSATIEMLKENSDKSDIFDLFKKYQRQYGFERLAEIFYRFKPIFLAFRTNRNIRPMINKIRKLATKCHKPMKLDYLNKITSMIKNNWTIDRKTLINHLNNANPFRKIRLAYALKYRTQDTDSIVYKIRNGKGFADDFYFNQKTDATRILKIVLNSLAEDIKKNVSGKKIFIPEYIQYALPATEKQFTGNFPSGSCITVSKDMIFGVHWNDVDGHRIDLDLSLINSSGKIGWDSSYRTDDRSILFSGDMTEAHNGATELFYIKKRLKQESIMFVNYYNYDADVEVPFDIVVAKEKASNFGKNYIINPNNIKGIAKTKINQRQKVLGLLVATTKECRFYFSETSMGKSITSNQTDWGDKARKYLIQFYKNTISLNTVLENAGAIITNDKNDYDIDLSPEVLEKDTIIKLIIG